MMSIKDFKADLKSGSRRLVKICDQGQKSLTLLSSGQEQIACISLTGNKKTIGVRSVSYETLSKRCMPFLYAAYWGVTWRVEKGPIGNFFVQPPNAYSRNMSPSAYAITLSASAQCSLAPNAGAPQEATPPLDAIEPHKVLIEALTKLGALEERLRALESATTRHRRRRRRSKEPEVPTAPD
jgi:hypothetical protein